MNFKYIAIALPFIVNVQSTLACQGKIVIENVQNACTTLENLPSLPTHEEFVSYEIATNDLAQTKHILNDIDYCSMFNNVFKPFRQRIAERITRHDAYYKPTFCTIAQQLIQNKPKDVLNILENITGLDKYKGGLFNSNILVFPLVLECCILNKAMIEQIGSNKEQLKQIIAPLESEANKRKKNLSPFDNLKYRMIKSEIEYINQREKALENFEYAVVDVAFFMKENKSYFDLNKPYFDLAEKTQLFLNKPTSEQSVEDAQHLIETTKLLENPYYAVFCTKTDNGYGLKHVHNFLLEHTK